jgi:hypothetical protein
MSNKKITRETELAVRGLIQLCKSKLDQLHDYEQEIAALLIVASDDDSPRPYFGHVTDAVFGGENAEYLFSKLHIELENKKPKPKSNGKI